MLEPGWVLEPLSIAGMGLERMGRMWINGEPVVSNGHRSASMIHVRVGRVARCKTRRDSPLLCGAGRDARAVRCVTQCKVDGYGVRKMGAFGY